jgi:DNA-binding NarL/FixJ family response regulator
VIVLLTNDLMFQSRISGAAKNAGKVLVVDRTVERVVQRSEHPSEVTLVLIDLSLAALPLAEAIPQLKLAFASAKVLAFGPHVDVDRLSEAQESGADAVLTRGQLDRDLVSIVGG